VRESDVGTNALVGDGTVSLVGQIKFEAFDGTNEDASSIGLDRGSVTSSVMVPVPAALPMKAAAIGGLALLGRRRGC